MLGAFLVMLSTSAATASGATAIMGGGSNAALLAGLPLVGCVSEYVQRWGWSPLPHGTEQMLRDILQTLKSMGLQYSLEEQHDLPEHLIRQDADRAAAIEASGGGQQTSSTHQLKLTIRF